MKKVKQIVFVEAVCEVKDLEGHFSIRLPNTVHKCDDPNWQNGDKVTLILRWYTGEKTPAGTKD